METHDTKLIREEQLRRAKKEAEEIKKILKELTKLEKMKVLFSHDYILENKGCYNAEQVEALPFDNKEITLKKLFEFLPIKDFCWFLCKKAELTKAQNQLFALSCATFVLPVYEKHYPEDSRVKECIQATKDYLEGNCSLEELRVKRSAAAADAAADAFKEHVRAFVFETL